MLREENTRLKQVIALLTENFRQANETILSPAGNDVGMNGAISSPSLNDIGMNQPILLNTQSDIGMNDSISLDTQNYIGTRQSISSNTKNNYGTNGVFLSNTQNDHGMSGAILPASPPETQPKQPSETNVSSVLREIMAHSPRKGRHAAAKILLRLQVCERNTNKEWRALTGLSASGVAKQLMALKKRGLIMPVRFQQYCLGGNALKVFDKAIEIENHTPYH